MKRKKLALLLSAAMVLSLALTGCGGDGGSGGSEDSDVVKIGWIGPLTGDSALWGTCESQALQMYVDEQNEAGGVLGGKKLELVTYDIKSDTNEAVNAVKRLISNDKVSAILGPNSSAPAIAIKGALDQGKVPDIATVATNVAITVGEDGSVNPYNFRICFTDPYQGAVTGGFAADELGATRAAILYDVSSDYSQGFAQYFRETFEEKGGKIVAEEAGKTGDTDFRAQLTKIKEADPEVILLPLANYKDIALAANQAREMGIDATFFGGDTLPSDNIFEMAGPALEGTYVVNHFDYNDPAAEDITERYVEKYGKQPEINAYMVHDAFQLLIAAIEEAGSADPQAITDALTKVEIDGVTGHIKLGEDNHDPIGKEAAMQQIVKDENAEQGYSYKFIMKYSPEA